MTYTQLEIPFPKTEATQLEIQFPTEEKIEVKEQPEIKQMQQKKAA